MMCASMVTKQNQQKSMMTSKGKRMGSSRNRYHQIDGDTTDGQDQQQFLVRVDNRFLFLSLLSCIFMAFAVGRMARISLIINPNKYYFQLLLKQQQQQQEHNSNSINQKSLPTPILGAGKEVPHTEYSSKTFDTASSASIDSRWVVVTDPHSASSTAEQQQQNGYKSFSSSDKEKDGSQHQTQKELQSCYSDAEDADDEEEHLPEGEHLLIDIANVSGEFLRSEERLSNAMLTLIYGVGLTLLSYHCHEMASSGVHCAGILLESHISFHTFPSEGVIALDLFTCGTAKLLPVLPIVEELFAIPSKSNMDDDQKEETEATTIDPRPQMIWAFKYRGFSDNDPTDNQELGDLFFYPVGQMIDYKKQIAAVQTEYQRIEVYDIIDPWETFQSYSSYEKSMNTNEPSFESLHPAYFLPDRQIYLDGILQSRRFGEKPYHEALVHPAMFAHRNPKRVAIIGGGEGATLREVLKHRTVEKVVMVEIDGQMVKTSRKYLPGWSDCSNLIGSDIDCFKDPRVELHILDAFQWFIDRFAEDGVLKGKEEPFDVIIMDALDPQIQKDFVEKLYEGGPFLKAIPDALSEDGIFIGQIGAADTISDSGLDMTLKNKNVVNFMQTLVDIGFESIIEYEEAHGGFGEIGWQFLIAMKSFDSRAGWFANEAGVNLNIRTRSMPTKTGESPFLYFDGATMLSYLHPSKGSEVVFCRGPGNCEDKHGFDPEIPNLALSETLEVKSISIDDKSRRGVFAKRDIPARSYIGLEKLVRAIYMSPYTISLMNAFWNHKIARLWSIEALSQYLYEYGHSFSKYGKAGIAIDPSFRCFINHSCKETNNVGHTRTQTEEDPGSIYQEFSDQYFGKERMINNPFAERQTFVFSGAIPNRDIQAGEELLDSCDCMAGGNMELWKKDVLGLKTQCPVSGNGEV